MTARRRMRLLVDPVRCVVAGGVLEAADYGVDCLDVWGIGDDGADYGGDYWAITPDYGSGVTCIGLPGVHFEWVEE